MTFFSVFLEGFSAETSGVLIVTLLALLAVVFAVTLSVMLVYHWRRYSFRATAVPQMLLLYFVIAVPATVIILLSALSYIQSL